MCALLHMALNIAHAVQAQVEQPPQERPNGGAEAEDDFAGPSDEDSGGDSDGGSGTVSAADLRRAARASGSHPLQQGLRALSAKLLLQRGAKPSAQSMRELEEAESDSVESDGEESASEESDGDADADEAQQRGNGDAFASDQLDTGADAGAVQQSGSASDEDMTDLIDQRTQEAHQRRKEAAQAIVSANTDTCKAAKRPRESAPAEASSHHDRLRDGASEHADDGTTSEGSLAPEEARAVADQLQAAERQLLLASRTRAPDAAGDDSGGDDSSSASDNDDGGSVDGDDGMLALLQQAIAIKQQTGHAPAAAPRAQAPVASQQDAGPFGAKSAAAQAQAHASAAGSAALGTEAAVHQHVGAAAREQQPATDAVTFTPPLPATYDEFVELCGNHTGAQLSTLLRRLRSFHASALKADSGVKLQQLYAFMMQHFAELAGERPLPRASLHGLACELAATTQQVPLYAATLARARLAAMHEHFESCLHSPECGPMHLKVLRALLSNLTSVTQAARHSTRTPGVPGNFISQTCV